MVRFTTGCVVYGVHDFMECSHHLSRIPSVDHAANSNTHICRSGWYYTSPPLSSLTCARFVVPTCWSENQIWLMLKSQPLKPYLCFLIYFLKETPDVITIETIVQKTGPDSPVEPKKTGNQWPHMFNSTGRSAHAVKTGVNRSELGPTSGSCYKMLKKKICARGRIKPTPPV